MHELDIFNRKARIYNEQLRPEQLFLYVKSIKKELFLKELFIVDRLKLSNLRSLISFSLVRWLNGLILEKLEFKKNKFTSNLQLSRVAKCCF